MSISVPGLPEGWFLPAYVQRVKSCPFWINPKFESLLRETAKNLDETLFKRPSPDLDCLYNLGLRSVVFPHSFVMHDEWTPLLDSVIKLKTERFFNPYSTTPGSGRNAILGGAQYKGIGRNLAATRTDWTHSWGGMKYYEALGEIFFERLLNRVMPEASVPILGGFYYTDLELPFIIRSADFFRCEQLHPRMRAEERDLIKGYLGRMLGSDDETGYYRSITERFFSLMRLGFFHRSPSPGNISLDGRFLDHYSLEWMLPRNNGDFGISCEFLFDDPIGLQLDQETLKQHILNGNFNQVFHCYDLLNRQCQVIQESFKILDIPFETDSLEQIKKQFPEWAHFCIPMEQRLKLYPEFVRRHLLDCEDVEIFQTKSGSVMLRVGKFMGTKIINVFDHLLRTSLLGGSLQQADLMAVLNHVSRVFFKVDLADL